MRALLPLMKGEPMQPSREPVPLCGMDGSRMPLTASAPATSDPMEIALYPDQQECFGKVVAAYNRCPRGGRALVVAPTSWGKTILFATLIRWWFGRSEMPVIVI